MGRTQSRYWYHLWRKWLGLRGMREIMPKYQISFCCGATWHSSLILMSHHATLAHFKTHLKYLSRWERTWCPCALGGRHSQHLPVVWSSVVLAPQCNFQNVLGFVLWHRRSSAAIDSLKCRQVVGYIFQLSVSFVSLASAIEKDSKYLKEERSERWEGRLRFLQHVPEITGERKHSCLTWKTVK